MTRLVELVCPRCGRTTLAYAGQTVFHATCKRKARSYDPPPEYVEVKP